MQLRQVNALLFLDDILWRLRSFRSGRNESDKLASEFRLPSAQHTRGPNVDASVTFAVTTRVDVPSPISSIGHVHA